MKFAHLVIVVVAGAAQHSAFSGATPVPQWDDGSLDSFMPIRRPFASQGAERSSTSDGTSNMLQTSDTPRTLAPLPLNDLGSFGSQSNFMGDQESRLKFGSRMNDMGSQEAPLKFGSRMGGNSQGSIM
ncbi:hypothetical protein THASP1DRAFT_33641 [Thamnocephalis sphaerospora]|uniref:Uncharacterized protein n=1 Tax=Thamnocephalis sphaerospora TaxID=78915 RepID=A0A4P9XG37_9FUNG|nr:hypothetical protein THASP1DRAFT_33641 [Thamnocephalis sphaerospora]|eukprot:RKP04576.1 hypothetical protein THASP1DRAFT_33641 [Thamnocephalis sphaerospora]